MNHSAALERLCRVCGKSVTTKSVKTKYLCLKHVDALEQAFGITVNSDDPNAHPTYFCHSCKRVMDKVGPYYQYKTVLFEGWCPHTDERHCTVCDHYKTIQRGGRPPKPARTPGRPSDISPRYLMQHVRALSASSFLEPGESATVCQTHLSLPLAEFKCPLCRNLLRSPVELVPCRKVVCAECLCQEINDHNSLVCPCCNTDHLQDYSTIRAATPLVVNVLGSLCIVCSNCNAHMQLSTYREHITSRCQSSVPQVLPQSSIEEVLHQPLTAPLTALEQKLQTNLAKRSLTTGSEEGVLKLKTGGKVKKNTIIHMVLHLLRFSN